MEVTYLFENIFYLKCALGGQSHVPLANQQQESDETDVSLITGALRKHNLLSSEPTESSHSSSVVLRNQTMTVANTNSAGRRQSEISNIALRHCLL